ncbi:DNA-binding protein [Clostridium aestuarii]|uniref:DNA-binding protein n=1 Tax=Clostridium aestuarii TaxID=338193 RepID=A0ABT4CYS9_9CLOT|nr:PPC domain-containing DNA-binding protein [Clostridium aestuarii]MCY6484139.1 DNA-binding protein [Clostridium aestuarii]
MKFKKFDENTFVLRLEAGEEIVESLKLFSRINNIKAASVSGIGAVQKVVLAVYRPSIKGYKIRKFDKNFEMTNLEGNITTKDNKPYIHIHVTLADKEFRCFGGHLESAIIMPTCELVINVIHEDIERIYEESLNINVMDL